MNHRINRAAPFPAVHCFELNFLITLNDILLSRWSDDAYLQRVIDKDLDPLWSTVHRLVVDAGIRLVFRRERDEDVLECDDIQNLMYILSCRMAVMHPRNVLASLREMGISKCMLHSTFSKRKTSPHLSTVLSMVQHLGYTAVFITEFSKFTVRN